MAEPGGPVHTLLQSIWGRALHVLQAYPERKYVAPSDPFGATARPRAADFLLFDQATSPTVPK